MHISPEYLIDNILAYLCVFSFSQINSNHGRMWIKREIKINKNNWNIQVCLYVQDNRRATILQFILGQNVYNL